MLAAPCGSAHQPRAMGRHPTGADVPSLMDECHLHPVPRCGRGPSRVRPGAGLGCTIEAMPIYLDHAATTPLRREVLDAMLPYLTESFGNPSSAHAFGPAARAGARRSPRAGRARDSTREAREIVFTSGGTEANNLALKGAAWAGKARGHRIVTSSVEHHAVGHTLRYLEKFGFEIVELPVDRYGRVDPDQLEAALNDRTILVSIMLANNEVGTIQPIAEIAARVRARKGIAAPRRRRPGRAVSRPRRRGARRGPASRSAPTSSRARRASAPCTSDTGRTSWPSSRAARRSATAGPAPRTSPAPSAWPTAYELSCAERADDRRPAARASASGSPQPSCAVPGVELTGHPTERLPGLLSIIARDTDGASVAMSLDLEGIAASVGSACTTGSTEVSHVLTAMGYPEEEARGALRLSLGRTTTDDEIATAVRGRPAGRRLDAPGDRRGRRRSARPGRARVSRILVAMSGGVDSSVAAALLHRAGPRGRRRVDAPARRRRHVLRVQEELLLARCRRRRAAGRRPARTSRSTS